MARGRPRGVSLGIWEKRQERLRRTGFLWWERRWLAEHSLITSPAVRFMIAEREDFFRNFNKSYRGWFANYCKEIREMYQTQGWFFRDGRYNPFRMLEAYKDIMNQPDTPQLKKQVGKKDYMEARKKG